MKCNHCEHEFNIYMFAYRQIRKCPNCGQVYDMKFPVGTGFLPVIIGLVVCGLFAISTSYSMLVNAVVFLLVWYVIDIMMKMLFIYTNRYEIEEVNY